MSLAGFRAAPSDGSSALLVDHLGVVAAAHQRRFPTGVGRGRGRVLHQQTVAVAAGQSIVAALAGAGVAVEVSCEQGICGTCLCNVLDGEPDHRDEYLTDEEKAAGDQILLCCSRARSKRLVLDL